MSTKKPESREAEPEVEAGGPDASVPAGDLVSEESLGRLTLRKLTDLAERLGLRKVSRVKKEVLVAQVLEAHRTQIANGGAAASPAEAAPSTVAGSSAPGALVPGTPSDPDDSPLSHKFELSTPLAADDTGPRDIPWSYGRDRVTAMPVNPERLYAYWEVLEDSIRHARARLGKGGASARLVLRVYDVTGRIFDGTNAHTWFDHAIDRNDRQWFMDIGKPTSEVIVEVGLVADDGGFAKVARSGRTEFPRREPVAPSEPEWLTVRVGTGQIERAGSHHPWRPGPPPAIAGAPASPPLAPRLASVGGEGPMAHARLVPWEDVFHFGHAANEVVEWEEVRSDGTVEAYRQVTWDEPTTVTSWTAGPFSYPVELPEPVRESFSSRTRVFRVGARTHVVHGPWQVVIRGLGAHETRVVLSRWELYRSWDVVAHHQVETENETLTVEGAGAPIAGSSERVARGSSERRWGGASELRLGGGSEIFYLGASELRLGGASELMQAGASEYRLGGASERRLGGASEWVYAGASERLQAGASERLQAGASERLHAGAEAGAEAGAIAGREAAGRSGAYPEPPTASSRTTGAKP